MIDPAQPARPRIAAVDIARGLAILAMIVYHFAWDLGFLGLTTLDITQSAGWIVFQRLIVGSFIFLTGVSLALAHGRAIRWPAFWRRFGVILGAALLVTAGTYAFSPATFVYFGVLHAIALFSLLGLAFLRLLLAVVLAFAAAVIAASIFVQHPLFGEKPLSWIGLWDVPPPTEDLVPIFPWFGVALLGLAAARWARATGFAARLAALRFPPIPFRALETAGRWSLVIYLLHQPILLGGLMGYAQLSGRAEARRAENFVASCEASCGQSAGEAAYCTAYCACALERVATEDLWSVLDSPERSIEEDTALIDLANQCATQVLDERLLAP